MENTGRAAVAEFVATFGLVFIGASAVILSASGVLDLTGVCATRAPRTSPAASPSSSPPMAWRQ